MSREHQDDNCPGCKPVLVDSATGKILPDDSPEMKTLLRVWADTTIEERRAFHRVTVGNSQDPHDLDLMRVIADKFAAIRKAN